MDPEIAQITALMNRLAAAVARLPESHAREKDAKPDMPQGALADPKYRITGHTPHNTAPPSDPEIAELTADLTELVARMQRRQLSRAQIQSLQALSEKIPHARTPTENAFNAVQLITIDLLLRKGFREIWQQCTPEIRENISAHWQYLILQAFYPDPQRHPTHKGSNSPDDHTPPPPAHDSSGNPLAP
jgi:hypothetical protein